MVSKILKSRAGFTSIILYATQASKNHQVLLSKGVCDYDINTTIKDFYRQAALNKNIKKNAFHMVLSHHPEDSTKIIKREADILNTYLAKLKTKGIDFEQTQYIIYRHNDREHIHYHLLANYVTNEGKRLTDGNIGIKAKIISKEVTKEYNLTRAIKKGQEREQFQDINKEINQYGNEDKRKMEREEPDRSGFGYGG